MSKRKEPSPPFCLKGENRPHSFSAQKVRTVPTPFSAQKVRTVPTPFSARKVRTVPSFSALKVRTVPSFSALKVRTVPTPLHSFIPAIICGVNAPCLDSDSFTILCTGEYNGTINDESGEFYVVYRPIRRFDIFYCTKFWHFPAAVVNSE